MTPSSYSTNAIDKISSKWIIALNTKFLEPLGRHNFIAKTQKT